MSKKLILKPIIKGQKMPLHPRAKKYPYEDMKIGDCILFSTQTDDKFRHRASASYQHVRHKTGYVFTQRKTSKGIFVWRVK